MHRPHPGPSPAAESPAAESPAAGRSWDRRRLLGAAVPAALLGAGLSARPAGAAVVASPRFVTPTTLAELRKSGSGRAGSTYYVTDAGRAGIFVLDEDDHTSADDGGTTIVSATGARFTRQAEGDAVDVTWFGAVGDGATDDTAAIRQAVEAAAALRASISGGARPRLVFPFSSGFLTTDTIAVPPGVSVVMDSELVYAGPADRPALDIGAPGSSNGLTVMRLSAVCQKDSAQYADWSDEECVGIRLRNLQESIVYVERAIGFTVGVQALGEGAGFAYNQVHLGYIVDNKISVDLTNRSAPGIGWCNENLFVNGRLADNHSTAKIHGQGRIGIRIWSMDGTYIKNNNNYFLKPSIELKDPDAHPNEALPILIEHGQLNHFESVRNESNGPHVMRVLNKSTRNVVHTGYGRDAVDDQSDYPANEHHARATLTDAPALIFNSGALAELACYYDGATRIHIPGVSFGSYYSTTAGPAGRAVLADDHIELAGTSHDAIGVRIDTSGSKRFVVKADTLSGHGGRVYFACYDAAGAQLSDPGAGPGAALVRTQQAATVYWNAKAFGGAYLTGSDHSNLNFYFSVADEVATVRLMMWKGSASLQLRSFSIYALDPGSPAVTSGAGRPNDERLATTPPAQGAWPRGLLLHNAEPSVADGQVVTGWLKVTDAATNTLGADWVELRASAGAG